MLHCQVPFHLQVVVGGGWWQVVVVVVVVVVSRIYIESKTRQTFPSGD